MVPIRTVVTGVVLAASAAAGCQRPGGIDGVYNLVGMDIDGQKVPDGRLGQHPLAVQSVVIQGDKMTIYGDKKVTSTIKLDPSKTPAEFDLLDETGANVHTQGIYKLEGDTLTMCSRGMKVRRFERSGGVGVPSKSVEREEIPLPRPTEFRTGGEYSSILYVFRRNNGGRGR